MNKCIFCPGNILKNNYLHNLPGDECILYKSDNLYIQIDIAPITLGHILIIPIKHYLNFFELPKDIKEEVLILQDKIKKYYKDKYNSNVLFFEHGSVIDNMAGSSIDHAHLHCMPMNKPINLSKDLGSSINYNILKSNINFNNEFGYIYTEYNNKSNLYKVNNLPSQYLRKVIADNLKNNDYNWKNLISEEDNKKIINQTINDLKDLFK